jgi:diguanylate cyclase (GGDEF)-like protein/PAS domain S-box-containing protein
MVDRRAGLEFLERVPIAAALVDPTGAIVGMNERLTRVVTRSVSVGDQAFDFIHPDDRDRLATVLLQLVEGERPGGVAEPVRILDGNESWLDVVCTGLDLLAEPGFEACLTLVRVPPSAGELAGGSGWFEAVVSGSDDIVQVVDEHGRYLWASGPIEELLGIGSEAMVGRTLVQLSDPEVAELAQAWLDAVIATPGPHRPTVGTVPNAAGELVQIEVRAANLLHDPDVRGVVLHTRDVSDRMRAAEASQFALEVVERAPTSIVTTDAEGRITSWNPAAEQVLGWRESEVVGRRFRDLGILTDESFGAIIGQIERVLRGELVELETTYVHRDGSMVPIYTVMSGRLGGDGRFDGMLVFGLDLRAQVDSRSALADTEARWTALSRASHELIALIEADRSIRWAGAGFANLLGLDPAALAGTHLHDLIHPDDRGQSGGVEAFDRQGGGSISCSYRLRHRDGSWRVFDITFTDLRHEPSVDAFLLSGRDVTDRVRAEADNRRLANVVDTAGAAVVVTDLHGVVVSWNQGAERMLGFTAEQAIGRPSPVTVEPEEVERWAKALDAITDGAATTLDVDVRAADGRAVTLSVTGSPVTNEDGAVVGRSFVCLDTTERREAERERTAREEQSRHLAALGQRALAGAPLADVLGDACNLVQRTLSVTHVHVGLFGDDRRYHEIAAACGPTAYDLGRREPAERRAWVQLLEDRALPVVVEDFDDPGAVARPFAFEGWPVRSGVLCPIDGRDGPVGWLSAVSDVPRAHPELELTFLQALTNVLATAIERSRVSDEMRRRALHDELTGLPNRTLLLDRLGQSLQRLGRRGGTVALLFVDLDRFKRVNDTLGHGAGDEVLVSSARRLLASVRLGDTVARTGGDEFLILTDELLDPADAIGLAERVAAALGQPIDVQGHPVFISASIGVAITQTEVDPDELVRDADLAMYRAKEDGRARVQLFDATMRDEAMTRMALEVALRDAVANDGIDVVFQPQVRLADGTTVGFEALSRWHHPQLGVVAPSSFVALAEEIGVLDEITTVVLRAACRTASAARALVPDLSIAVNLSPRQLNSPDVVALITSVVDEQGVPRDALKIELTETTALDGHLALTTLQELQSAGFELAIDDFGTGYSSMSRLTRLPVGSVKIDRSFVAGIAHDKGCAAVVSATMSLGEVLGIEVVAEGVETQAQSDRLQALGCGIGQGWLFSGPLDHDAVLEWLAR